MAVVEEVRHRLAAAGDADRHGQDFIRKAIRWAMREHAKTEQGGSPTS